MQLHLLGGPEGEYFNILGPKFNVEQRGLQHVGVCFFDMSVWALLFSTNME